MSGFVVGALELSTGVLSSMTLIGQFSRMIRGVGAATGVAAAAQGVGAAATMAQGVAAGVATAPTFAFAGAMWAAAWPILAVVAGLALLTGGVFLVVKNWDKLTGKFRRSKRSIVEAVDAASGVADIKFDPAVLAHFQGLATETERITASAKSLQGQAGSLVNDQTIMLLEGRIEQLNSYIRAVEQGQRPPGEGGITRADRFNLWLEKMGGKYLSIGPQAPAYQAAIHLADASKHHSRSVHLLAKAEEAAAAGNVAAAQDLTARAARRVGMQVEQEELARKTGAMEAGARIVAEQAGTFKLAERAGSLMERSEVARAAGSVADADLFRDMAQDVAMEAAGMFRGAGLPIPETLVPALAGADTAPPLVAAPSATVIAGAAPAPAATVAQPATPTVTVAQAPTPAVTVAQAPVVVPETSAVPTLIAAPAAAAPATLGPATPPTVPPLIAAPVQPAAFGPAHFTGCGNSDDAGSGSSRGRAGARRRHRDRARPAARTANANIGR